MSEKEIKKKRRKDRKKKEKQRKKEKKRKTKVKPLLDSEKNEVPESPPSQDPL